MIFESRVFQIWLSTTINTLHAVVKFFSSVKLDTFAKSPLSLAMSHSSYRYELTFKYRTCWFCTLEPVLTDFFLYSFSNFHAVPLHTLLMAIVAVVITKIHNQVRREAIVGPGPAQIWRISGSVNSKTNGDNQQFYPNSDVISKKEKESNGFSGQN